MIFLGDSDTMMRREGKRIKWRNAEQISRNNDKTKQYKKRWKLNYYAKATRETVSKVRIGLFSVANWADANNFKYSRTERTRSVLAASQLDIFGPGLLTSEDIIHPAHSEGKHSHLCTPTTSQQHAQALHRYNSGIQEKKNAHYKWNENNYKIVLQWVGGCMWLPLVFLYVFLSRLLLLRLFVIVVR